MAVLQFYRLTFRVLFKVSLSIFTSNLCFAIIHLKPIIKIPSNGPCVVYTSKIPALMNNRVHIKYAPVVSALL